MIRGTDFSARPCGWRNSLADVLLSFSISLAREVILTIAGLRRGMGLRASCLSKVRNWGWVGPAMLTAWSLFCSAPRMRRTVTTEFFPWMHWAREPVFQMLSEMEGKPLRTGHVGGKTLLAARSRTIERMVVRNVVRVGSALVLSSP